MSRSQAAGSTEQKPQLDHAYSREFLNVTYHQQGNGTCDGLLSKLEHIEQSHTESSPYKLAKIYANTTFAKYLYNAPQFAIVKIRSCDERRPRLKIFFNDSYFHSMPVMLSIVSNWFSEFHSLPNISIGNQPYERTPPIIVVDKIMNLGLMLVGISMYITPTAMSFDLVGDRIVSNHIMPRTLYFPKSHFYHYFSAVTFPARCEELADHQWRFTGHVLFFLLHCVHCHMFFAFGYIFCLCFNNGFAPV